MAQTTKRALAASLKKLLAQKSLDKITVTDIASDCKVNRQTFYYHFQDIYDLIEWVFLEEASEAVGEKRTYDTWQDGLLQVFQAVLDNKPLILNTYHSISREHVERYLYELIYRLLIDVVEEKAAGMAVRDEDKKFIADFYKFAFTGMLLDWIRQGMKEDPGEIVGRLSILIHGDITRALEKYRTDRPLD